MKHHEFRNSRFKLTKLALIVAVALPLAPQGIAQDKVAPAASTPAPPPAASPTKLPADVPVAPPPPPPPTTSKPSKNPLVKMAPPMMAPRAPLYNREPSDQEMLVAASADGNTLFLLGTIRQGSFSKFKKLADANPKATQVVLFSRGGSVMEASIIARYIANRGMNTFVDGVCISACTQIFAGGKQRVLGTTGHMGFHAVRRAFSLFNTEPAGTVPKTGRLIYTMPFKSAGIDPALVEKAMKVPHQSIWYPSQSELISYRFVTQASAVPGPAYPESFGKTRQDIEKKVLKQEFWQKVKQLQPSLFNQSVQMGWSEMVLAKKWNDEETQVMRALAQRLNEDVGTVTDESLMDKVADLMKRRVKLLSEKERAVCGSGAVTPFNQTKSGKIDLDEEETALMLQVIQAPRKAYTMTEDDASEISMGFYVDLMARGTIDASTQTSLSVRSCDAAVKFAEAIAELTPPETAKLFRAFDSSARNADSTVQPSDWNMSNGWE